jgi:hypothetical protein
MMFYTGTPIKIRNNRNRSKREKIYTGRYRYMLEPEQYQTHPVQSYGAAMHNIIPVPTQFLPIFANM